MESYDFSKLIHFAVNLSSGCTLHVPVLLYPYERLYYLRKFAINSKCFCQAFPKVRFSSKFYHQACILTQVDSCIYKYRYSCVIANKTKAYGRYSDKISYIFIWNFFQKIQIKKVSCDILFL